MWCWQLGNSLLWIFTTLGLSETALNFLWLPPLNSTCYAETFDGRERLDFLFVRLSHFCQKFWKVILDQQASGLLGCHKKNLNLFVAFWGVTKRTLICLCKYQGPLQWEPQYNEHTHIGGLWIESARNGHFVQETCKKMGAKLGILTFLHHFSHYLSLLWRFNGGLIY